MNESDTGATRENVIGFDTPFGYRTVELLRGDITTLPERVDILVVSAFSRDYDPLPGTVIDALDRRLGIRLDDLARTPAIDLRDALSVWLSRELPDGPVARVLCAELSGGHHGTDEILENVFAALLLAEAKRVEAGSVAMPLLGGGHQQLPPREVAELLVARAYSFLQRSHSCGRVQFVEIDHQRAASISDAMDQHLGRVRVTLPKEQLVASLRQEVRHRLLASEDLFFNGSESLRTEWLVLADQEEVRSTELGVAARKLVEALLNRLVGAGQPLFKRIRTLEEKGTVAPWICGYMHVLRHLGNESAHEQPTGGRRPPTVSPEDLIAGLFCVQRLLDFWIAERESLGQERQG
jgi:O-acetyl-ADP-ribose deacetylase (regulator of RNase III)